MLIKCKDVFSTRRKWLNTTHFGECMSSETHKVEDVEADSHGSVSPDLLSDRIDGRLNFE